MWAWVTAAGDWATGKAEVGTSVEAEISAVCHADIGCADLYPGQRRITVSSDCRAAVSAVSAFVDGVRMPRVNNVIEPLLLAVRTISEQRQVAVYWVRGHNGDRMNEIADRLANNRCRA